MLVRLTQPRDYDLRRTLLAAGFPRSGTTWLAEILCSLPGTGIAFEPLDAQRVRAARKAGCDWENFFPPEAEWPAGEEYIGRVLTGHAPTAWTTSHLPLSRAWQVDRWVIKLVRGNQMLAWVVAHFDILPPVLLVRHPCAVYASWLSRGWPIHRAAPRPSFRFFKAYPELKKVIPQLKTPEEFFVADWCMQHYTPLNQLAPESYQLCFYEHLRTDGVQEIRRIFRRWKLPVPDHLERSLVRPSAKASEDLKARGVGRSGGWQNRLGPAVIERMVGVLEQFGLHFYGTGPEPKPTALTTI